MYREGGLHVNTQRQRERWGRLAMIRVSRRWIDFTYAERAEIDQRIYTLKCRSFQRSFKGGSPSLPNEIGFSIPLYARMSAPDSAPSQPQSPPFAGQAMKQPNVP